jgi:hypothetical protein
MPTEGFFWSTVSAAKAKTRNTANWLKAQLLHFSGFANTTIYHGKPQELPKVIPPNKPWQSLQPDLKST